MTDALPGLVPLEGGFSGETFASEYAGELAVVRIYGRRSANRGPLAAEIDAAVLGLVRGLVPVPAVLEVRRGDPETGAPALLITSRVPGERLDLVLPVLDSAGRTFVAEQLGVLIGRLGHLAQPRAGVFSDPGLVVGSFPEGSDLPEWVEAHAPQLGLDAEEIESLRELADDAQTLLDDESRVCLVHADFNPGNVLVDPVSLEVTGVVDWEFAHAGSPFADLGNLLRFEADQVFEDAVLASYARFMPDVPDRLRDRARAADLVALVELASRRGGHGTADEALALVRRQLAPGRSGQRPE
jgi:aminoglycoside phosphotransferase (APT) family kinase protein